jgi:hypothetical protein
MKPKVSIIILNYNGRSKLGALLDECITSALNQTYSNVEVIFADNGSADDSCEYVRARYGDRVRIVCLGRNYGFTLGNNLASKFVSKDSEYLLFLNPDAILEPSYVETIVRFMEENKWIGAAQGLEVSMDGSFISLGGYIDYYGRSVKITVKNLIPRYPLMILWTSGSAMVVRRKLFTKLGGFSPELFLYYDEIDLCSRIWSSGYAVISIPYTKYRHLEEGIVKSINWIGWYFMSRNRWLISIRYMPLKNLIVSLFLFLPVDFMINIIRSIKNKQQKLRTLLYIRILLFLLKKLPDIFHKRYIKGNISTKFIVNIKSLFSRNPEASTIFQLLNNNLLISKEQSLKITK